MLVKIVVDVFSAGLKMRPSSAAPGVFGEGGRASEAKDFCKSA